MRSLLARNLNQLPGKTRFFLLILENHLKNIFHRVFGLSNFVLQPGRAFAAAVPSASEISIEASNEVQTKVFQSKINGRKSEKKLKKSKKWEKIPKIF